MGEGDRAEWLYWDYWRRHWKLGVVPLTSFGCIMSLMTLESEGSSRISIELLVWWGLGSLSPGIAFGAWTAWQRGEQWPQAKDLTLGGRWKVLRGLRSGTSPQEAHLARALLGQVSAGDQLRQEDGFMASSTPAPCRSRWPPCWICLRSRSPQEVLAAEGTT